jgi:hypothetical protein
VVLATRDGVEGLDRSEEITMGQSASIDHSKGDIPRDELGTLVNELVEGVLAVGTALSPDDGLSVFSCILTTYGAEDSLQSRSQPWIHPW